jgi:hypothetical protein
VKDAEAAYPGDTPEQILTRTRQMYYPGTRPDGLTFREAVFDQLMLDSPVREASGARRLLKSPPLNQTAFARLTASAFENATPPLPPDNPGPYLVDPGEQRVDIGHPLTIDVVHTTTGQPYLGFESRRSTPPAGADVGIAAVGREERPPARPVEAASGDPDTDGYFFLAPGS